VQRRIEHIAISDDETTFMRDRLLDFSCQIVQMHPCRRGASMKTALLVFRAEILVQIGKDFLYLIWFY
jgi:hypothetical protein